MRSQCDALGSLLLLTGSRSFSKRLGGARMAKYSFIDKVHRVIAFVYGLADPDVARELIAAGFTEADLEEAWRLLREVRPVRFDLPEREDDVVLSQVLQALDAWENRWVPVIDASLRRRHPEVHARVMLNLSQTSGRMVHMMVDTVLERIAALETSSAAGDLAARAHLEKRGLSAEVIAEARRLIDRIERPKFVPSLPTAAELAARERAEAELWGWYLEWSAIARARIRSRSMLQKLGFRRARKKSEPSGDE